MQMQCRYQLWREKALLSAVGCVLCLGRLNRVPEQPQPSSEGQVPVSSLDVMFCRWQNNYRLCNAVICNKSEGVGISWEVSSED